jgi:hypothetical protein
MLVLWYDTDVYEVHAASICLHWYPTTTMTRLRNPEDLDLKHHHRESLKTCMHELVNRFC